jgi:DNA mismatch repair ATPase MutS
MFEDDDFNPCIFPKNRADLSSDLELKTLFEAMAAGDEFILDVVTKAVLSSLSNDADTIVYRQEILRDCIRNPLVIKEIYFLAEEAIGVQKRHFYGIFMRYPSSILGDSLDLLLIFVDMLKKLRSLAEKNSDEFLSKGFKRFFSMIKEELTDDYLSQITTCLKRLKFKNGILSGVTLGPFNKGQGYYLREPLKETSWWQHFLAHESKEYTFHIAPGDENGFNALSDLKDRAINEVANSLAQSADHIIRFFSMVSKELAFYLGCLNLHNRLNSLHLGVSFPQSEKPELKAYTARKMYDICLALSSEKPVASNSIQADEKRLVIITGANRGGKSTFLRAVGLTQLMMQSGMFVPAEFVHASVCDSLFTHYKREEDTSLKSGKLDEELARMSEIVDQITPHSMLLLNESFAATNEREGSEIANQITKALLDHNIRIFFVTHLYEFAHYCYQRRKHETVFLVAERQSDGTRTFKLKVGEPLQTSYGVDLYHKIFDRRA